MVNLRTQLCLVVLISTFCFIDSASAQFKAISLDLAVVRGVIDDYEDTEFEYNRQGGDAMLHIGLGYSFSVTKNVTIGPKVGYAQSLSIFENRNTSFLNLFDPNNLYVGKDNKNVYLKLGAIANYWITTPGKGFFIESDLQGVFLISAKSRVKRQLETMEVIEYTEDYSDNVKNFVPSLRLGVGFNLPVDRFNLFIVLSREFRLSTYYTTTGNYRFMNFAIGFGANYRIQDAVENDPKL